MSVLLITGKLESLADIVRLLESSRGLSFQTKLHDKQNVAFIERNRLQVSKIAKQYSYQLVIVSSSIQGKVARFVPKK